MLEYIETHLTHHCNLNCKGCTHYAPLAKPWFKDIGEYIKEIARLAQLTNGQIPTIRLLGGEPLLHPQVKDFCYITRQAFPNSEIQLVTNGTLLPQQPKEFFDVINENGIIVYLSDYNLSQTIKDTMKKNLNPHLIYIGPKEVMIKPAVDLASTNDKTMVFRECRNTFREWCTNLRDGYIYHCPTEAYFDFLLDYFNLNIENYDVTNHGINIFTNDLDAIEKYIANPDEFCKYCDMPEKNARPFGLSKKQISEWLS